MAMSLNPQFTSILKEHGLSVTKPRRIIFDILSGKDSLTIHDLYSKANGAIDRASVYRTVTLFERLGIISRVYIGWKYKIELSDIFAEHHHHLTCSHCHRVIPINEQALESFIHTIAADNNFLPIHHQIEVQGYCVDCQKMQ